MQELRALRLRSEIKAVAAALWAARSACDLRYSRLASRSEAATGTFTTMVVRVLSAPRVCPAHERHVRRPGWTELFFDLVFAAAIAH